MLLEDYRAMLDEAALALSAGDFEKAASIAHTLKGMIGNFAAPDASKAAQAFYAATHGAHPERSAKAYERLKSRLSLLAEALRNDPILAAAAS
jgi:HPt (histidine-containing phosphotransfer) domain-containing protein